MMVSRRWDLGGGKNTKNNWLMEADNWRGPWRNITKSYADAIVSGEDPVRKQCNTGPTERMPAIAAGPTSLH